uniref:Secreted protein n=1 Tax=Magallana gigas TaxID=29159 RepID=A0A8W8MQY5_MAGGI
MRRCFVWNVVCSLLMGRQNFVGIVVPRYPQPPKKQILVLKSSLLRLFRELYLKAQWRVWRNLKKNIPPTLDTNQCRRNEQVNQKK